MEIQPYRFRLIWAGKLAIKERGIAVAETRNDELKRLIGMKIKALRNSKSFTQEQLAEKVGITPQYLGNIERGKENPTLNTFINLSNAIDVSLNEIFNLLEAEDPKKVKRLIQERIKNADENELKLILKLVSNIV